MVPNPDAPLYTVPAYNAVNIGDAAAKCVKNTWTIIVHVKIAQGYRWSGPPGTLEVQLNGVAPSTTAALGYVLLTTTQEKDKVTFRGSGGQTLDATIDDAVYADWRVLRSERVSIADGQTKEVTLELKIPKVMFRVFDEKRKQMVPDVTIDLDQTWKGAASQTSHVTTPSVLVVLRVDEASTVNVRGMSHGTEVWEVTKVESA
jgi:hypothetical protein